MNSTGISASNDEPCKTCENYLRQYCIHPMNESCPVRASFWCSQCSCNGHLPSECDESNSKHVWRPSTLEELIPPDVRARWNITTSTPIQWKKGSEMTMEDAEREIGDSVGNTIEIRFKDAEIRRVMKSLKIPTVHKMDGNIQLIRSWALKHGKKVRLVQEGGGGGKE